MKVLVTGGAGFVGSYVTEGLQRAGDDVLVIDDMSSGDFGWIPDDFVVRADIRSPQAAQAVETFRPDAMVLLAAQMSVKVSMRNPILDAEMNVVGLVAMLEAGLRAGCGRFAFASSGGTIYGDVPVAQQPITEGHPREPRSFYGITKSVAVSYLDVYARTRGIEYVALALGNVYGPRQNSRGEAGVVAIFAEQVARGLPCTVNGDGGATRDYVHVDDVARAFVLASRRGTGLMNIGTGIGTTVLDVHKRVSQAARKSGTTPRFGPAMPGEVRSVALDPTRAAVELGWRPEVTLDEGVPGVVEWVADQVAATVSEGG